MKKEAVLTFPNTHNAMSAEQALMGNAVNVRVMSRPSALGEGCGICLRVNEDEQEKARSLLAASGIGIEAAYWKIRENGKTLYQPIN